MKSTKVLFITREGDDTNRADITSLFGKYLKRSKYLIARLCTSSRSNQLIDCRRVDNYALISVGSRCSFFFRGTILKLFRDLLAIKLLFSKQYDLVVVRDEPFTCALLLLVPFIRSKFKLVYWKSYPTTFAQLDLAKTKKGLRSIPYWGRGYFLHFLFVKIVLRKVDFMVVQSERMKSDLMKIGGRAHLMQPVPMGVDVTLENPGQTKVLTKELTVGYLGTLEHERNPEILVEILSKLHRSDCKARLLIVGDGPARRNIEIAADAFGLTDFVEITGFLKRSEAWKRISESEVCISPYKPDFLLDSTSPTKLIEYFLLKKPVVCNKHPEQIEVIRESKGGVCVDWRIDSFAEAILKLLADKPEATRMGVNGYEYCVKKRTYSVISRDVAAILKKVIE